jgi:hypothetical protein
MLVVACVPASDGVPVDPCGSLDGQALVPVVQQLGGGELDHSELGALFAYGLSIILVGFLIGAVVGHVIRLIRSA